MSDDEPTPLRTGSRGSRARLAGKVPPSPELTLISDEQLTILHGQYEKRHWKRYVLPRLALIPLLGLLGYGSSRAVDLHDWPLFATQLTAAALVVAIYFLLTSNPTPRLDLSGSAPAESSDEAGNPRPS